LAQSPTWFRALNIKQGGIYETFLQRFDWKKL